MHLEEYLSFVSLSLAQSEQKSLQDCLNMSEQEKFYHYITLKRWMADYQKNVPESNGKECDCQDLKLKDQIFLQQKGLDCFVKEQGTSMQIQQKHTKKGSDMNHGKNTLFLFFQQLQHRFRLDRKRIQRILRKLKLKTTLEEFQVWVRANLPTSQTSISPQSTKSLMNSTKNKQESLLLRVLLKKYLKNEAYVQMLTLKDSKKMSLKDNLQALRIMEEQLFQQKK